MTDQTSKAKRWRPWQFSIRTLLLLMLVVASYLGGWMSNEWKRQRELERAKQEAESRQRMMMKMMAPSPPATLVTDAPAVEDD